MLFKIRVVGGSAAYSYLSPQDSRPLYHPAVERWDTQTHTDNDIKKINDIVSNK